MNSSYKMSAGSHENGLNSTLKSILDGLLISLPVIVVFALIYIIFEFIAKFLSPIVGIITPLFNLPEFMSKLLAMIVLVALFFIIGVALRKKQGRYLIKKIEKNYLMGIPLYSSISQMIKHFSGLKSMPFQQVVLVDPYDTGTLLTGFVTEEVSENMFTIFVPTAPNPLNGNIYHVPLERLRFLDIPSEEAMRTVVGVGSGSSILFAASPSPESNGLMQEPERIDPASDRVNGNL